MKISLDCPFKWSSSIVGGRGGGDFWAREKSGIHLSIPLGKDREQERIQNERQPVVFYLPDRLPNTILI
jgi:hypothetical protein